MKKLLTNLLFSFCFSASFFAQSTWNYLPNAPLSGRIDDVFFINSQIGWCGAGFGSIFKTTDGGQNWVEQISNIGYVRCVEFFNANIGYAGTLGGKFMRTTDGGTTWVNLAPAINPAPKAICGISLADSLVGYAVGQWDTPGFFLKTTDGGLSWQSHDMSEYAMALVDVFFISRDTGFVTGQGVSGKAVILYTTDGGLSWTKKFESSPIGHYVWKIQRVTTDFWVGSIQTFNGGRFAKSFDGGQSWTEHTAPVPDMQGIGFATPLHGWVGGYINGFYETKDGGDNWEYINFGASFNRFYFLNSGLAYASGSSIYKFSDTTLTATHQPLASKEHEDGFDLTLSPNPTSGIMDIKFMLPVEDNLRMGIYAMNGALIREVYHQRGLLPGVYTFEIDGTQLPAGAYFLGIQRNCGLYSKPFVKR